MASEENHKTVKRYKTIQNPLSSVIGFKNCIKQVYDSDF